MELCTIPGKLINRFSPVFSPDGKILAFSNQLDGRMLAYSSKNLGITLAETATGMEIMKLPGKPSETWTMLIFGKDGTKLYKRVGRERQVTEWDVATGKLLRKLGGDEKSQSGFWILNSKIKDGLSLSPDGNTLVLVGGEHSPRFLDIPSGKERAVANGHPKAIVALNFTPDSKRLVTQDNEPSIRQWDIVAGKDLGAINVPQRTIQAEISPDGKFIAAWSAGETTAVISLAFLDATTGKEFAKPGMTEEAPTWPMVFSGDGRRLVLHSPSKPKINVYSVPSGTLLHVLQFKPYKGVKNKSILGNTLIASPDGNLLACYDFQKNLIFWDITTGEEVGILQMPKNQTF